jgi:hypothetical protein
MLINLLLYVTLPIIRPSQREMRYSSRFNSNLLRKATETVIGRRRKKQEKSGFLILHAWLR